MPELKPHTTQRLGEGAMCTCILGPFLVESCSFVCQQQAKLPAVAYVTSGLAGDGRGRGRRGCDEA